MARPVHSISSLSAVEGARIRKNAEEVEERSKVEAMQEEGERKENQRPQAGRSTGRGTGSGRLWGLQITRNNSRSGGLQEH